MQIILKKNNLRVVLSVLGLICVGNGRDRSLYGPVFRIGFNIMFDKNH